MSAILYQNGTRQGLNEDISSPANLVESRLRGVTMDCRDRAISWSAIVVQPRFGTEADTQFLESRRG